MCSLRLLREAARVGRVDLKRLIVTSFIRCRQIASGGQVERVLFLLDAVASNYGLFGRSTMRSHL